MGLSKLLKFIDDGTSFKIKPETIKGLGDIEGGADAVAKLKQNFTLTPLKDGSLFAEQKATQEAIDAVKADISTQAQIIDTNDNYAYKILNSEIPGGDSPITHLLNTSGTVSGITLPQEMLKSWKTLQGTAETLTVSLKPQEFDVAPVVGDWAGKKIKNTFFQIVSSPKQAMGELAGDLVTNSREQQFVAHKFGKHANETWKKLTGRLSNKERDDLNRILELGNDEEEVFTPVVGGLKTKGGAVIEASEETVEAYYGSRMLMDHMYWLTNKAAVRQANRNGIRVLTADPTNPTKTMNVRAIKGRHGDSYSVFKPTEAGEAKYIKWSKDIEKEGMQVVEFVGKEGQRQKMVMSSADYKAYTKEISDSHPLVGYRTGYVPRKYEDQWAVNKLARLKDGTYRAERIATAPTRVKASKAVAKFDNEITLAEDELEVQHIFSRKNDVSTDLGYGENLHTIIDNMSTSEIEALKTALVRMGLDPEIASSLEGTARFFSHKRSPFMHTRGARLKDWKGEGAAKILPADAAIQKYLHQSSGYAANADYVAQLESKYLDEFGELLTDPSDFMSPIRRTGLALSSNGRSAHEAAIVRGQIERVAGIASHADRTIENFVIAGLDKFAVTKTGKAFNYFVDKLSEIWGLEKLVGTPSPAKAAAKIKGFTAIVKLGLFNFSQAVVQGSASLNVLGKNPIVATAAAKDVIQALGPEIMKVGRTAEGRRLYKLIDDSGFIAGTNYVELQRVAAKGTDKLLGSRSLRKLWDLNLLPYHLGEGGVRALAWFTEYRILKKEILSGLSDLKSADIDKAKFLQRVNEKASITALDMSRINQPLISRGFFGVPFQFKQFLIHQGEFLLNASNFRSFRERLTVYGAWVGAFGIQGIPWLFDVTLMAEDFSVMLAGMAEKLGFEASSPHVQGKVRKQAQEYVHHMSKQLADNKFARMITDTVGKKRYEDAVAFWDRFAQSGSMSAISDGEWNIASRASLARVLTEYHGTQTLDETLFGPGYQTAIMLIDNNITNLHDMITLWRRDDAITPGYMLTAAARSARGLPGIQHPLEAANMYLTGEWRDSELRLIAEEPTLQQILLLGTGFGPGKRSEQFERLEFTQRQKKAWTEWIKGRTKKIARLTHEGHKEYAKAVFNDTLKQIQDVNPTLAKELMMAHSSEMLRRGLTDDQRELMYRFQDSYFYDSSYDKFFFGRDAYIGWEDDK